MTDFAAQLPRLRAEIDAALDEALTSNGDGGRIVGHWRAVPPGKRLRPIAALLAGECFGAERRGVLPFAVAVELVHCASLILDDLPAMDDAASRRGAPALHKQVGEADAILAAFGLLARAFPLAAAVNDDGGELGRRLVEILESAAGAAGMCEGQSLDLAFDGSGGLAALRAIHRLKTGSLFRTALHGGALIAGATPEQCGRILDYGDALGVAFQIADDLRDRADETATTRPGAAALVGLDGAREALRESFAGARAAVTSLGSGASRLIAFADHLEASA